MFPLLVHTKLHHALLKAVIAQVHHGLFLHSGTDDARRLRIPKVLGCEEFRRGRAALLCGRSVTFSKIDRDASEAVSLQSFLLAVLKVLAAAAVRGMAVEDCRTLGSSSSSKPSSESLPTFWLVPLDAPPTWSRWRPSVTRAHNKAALSKRNISTDCPKSAKRSHQASSVLAEAASQSARPLKPPRN